MKIKSENGMVTFVMRTGKDKVRSQMPITYAQSVISKGKEVVEQNDEIIVDDTYFFPAEPKTRKKKTDEVTE